MRAGEEHQVLGMVHEAGDEVILRRHMGEKAGLDGAEPHPVLGERRVLPRLELEREDLGEEVAGIAHLQRHPLRLLVVAGDQAPQVAVAQDRDRHGGERPHVAHVFEMDRRHAAQHGIAQIERIGASRLDRDRRVIGIGDDAQPVAAVEIARLGRECRRRESAGRDRTAGPRCGPPRSRCRSTARRSDRSGRGRSRSCGGCPAPRAGTERRWWRRPAADPRTGAGSDRACRCWTTCLMAALPVR